MSHTSMDKNYLHRKSKKRERYLQQVVENSVLGVHSKEFIFLHTHLYTFSILKENILFVSTCQCHSYLQDFAMLHALRTVDSEAQQYM